MTQLPVTPLEHLASFVNDQQVPCVEGQLVAIKDPKQGNFPDGKPSWEQSVAIKQGNTEMWVRFNDPKHEQNTSNKGKKIRISCYAGQKGLSGVKIKTWDGGNKRNIHVTATANVEILGAGGEPPKPSNQSHASKPSTGAVSTASGRNGAQVGNAINNATLMLAHGFIKPEGNALEQLESTAKEILQIADRLESFTPDKPSQVTETKLGWKYAKSPTNGKTLEEYQSEGKLGDLFKWAFSNPSPKEDQKTFHANILLAAAEMDVTPLSFIVDAGASAEGLEALIQRDLFKSVNDLIPEEWATLYKNFDKSIATSKELATNQDIPF